MGEDPRLTVVQGDLNRGDFIADLPEKVDAILHFAQANVRFPEGANDLFKVNALSTQLLADYARRAGAARFIFASSGNVYGEVADQVHEDMCLRPNGLYSVTKRVSEDVLQLYSTYFHTCSLRLFAVYGPGQRGRMIPEILRRVLSREKVILTNDGQPRSNPTYIDDVVRVVDQALSLNGYHAVNVAGPKVVSIADIAKIAGQALGVEPIFEHRTDPKQLNSIASTTKMHNLFHLPPMVPPEKGVRQVAEAMLRS
jgi:nucleoside-diphosphate-sugar epimerase